eukprot:GHVP01061904.1.p1 GENE.GHVP01061904.1~~GHVP01061904.1.p1  ORF type:complete len:318 (+),score=58.40 GHVP01061904.1:25-954(+)
MDIKILFYQLNGAAEEYFLAPSDNGFSAADDIIPGNALEPEFQGLVRRIFHSEISKDDGLFKSRGNFEHDFSKPLANFFWFKVKQILEESNFSFDFNQRRFQLLQKREISPHSFKVKFPYEVEFHYGEKIMKKELQKLENLPQDYNFIIQSDHQIYSPSYTIRVCNCSPNSEGWKEGAINNQKACGGKGCSQFQVTLRYADQKAEFRWLWWAFEAASYYAIFQEYLSDDSDHFGDGLEKGSFLEENRKEVEDILNRKFEPLYRSIYPSEADSEESTGPVEDSTAFAEEWTGAKIDWEGEKHLWCVRKNF